MDEQNFETLREVLLPFLTLVVGILLRRILPRRIATLFRKTRRHAEPTPEPSTDQQGNAAPLAADKEAQVAKEKDQTSVEDWVYKVIGGGAVAASLITICALLVALIWFPLFPPDTPVWLRTLLILIFIGLILAVLWVATLWRQFRK